MIGDGSWSPPIYPGFGTSGPHAYLVGDEAAYAVLDSVRAARGLADAVAG